MTTRRLLLTILTATAITATAQQAAMPQVLIYCPGEREGLHIAQQTAEGWQDLGQLCSSDYGQWGAEKRMYHPSLGAK